MIKKILMLSVIAAYGSAAMASNDFEITSCPMANAVENAVEEEFHKLMRNYPGTMLYFGMSGAVISEIKPDSVEGMLASLGASALGCYFLIDSQSCNHVSSTLGTMFVAQGLVCAYDSIHHCRNVC